MTKEFFENVKTLQKKFGDKTAEEKLKIMQEYEASVKKKIDAIFSLIKMEADNGNRSIGIKEGCEWIDAFQNVLNNLLIMLKSTEPENTFITKDFIVRVVRNLEAINEGN